MADCKRKTANLFDGTLIGGVFTDADWTISPTVSTTTFKSIKVYLSAGTYTFGFEIPVNIVRTVIDGQYAQAYDTNVTSYTITITANGYVGISFRANASSTEPWDNSNIMLNTGSTPLPYEPYGWNHSLRKLTTATDTITTLPADVYTDGNNATVGLVGNMVQTGTPTPSSPIYPTECGDLETTGEHAGQYKIPISSANTTTPVYLGEVETTRKIKKYEFTGQEDWSISNNERVLYTALADHLTSNELICYCSHYKSIANISAMSALSDGECAFNNTLRWFYIKDDNYNNANSFKAYLQQQYAAGTPVTIWYVLATETTGVVNEPLRKIGNYADTVSGITIPTITGKDSFDVLTTLKPSEVDLTYTGWHDATVEEWDGSDWE